MKSSPYRLKAADVIAGAFFILAGLSIYFIGGSIYKEEQGSTVNITVEGKTWGNFSLGEDKTFTVSTKFGSNEIEIKNGKVRVISADCPDEYCVSSREISHNGESIVCLPHKLSVTIGKNKNGENDIDAVAS